MKSALAVLLLFVATQVGAAELQIVSASYGAKDAWIDVTEKVRALVQRDALTVKSDTSLAGNDPVFGVVKELRLIYRVGSQQYFFSIREGETGTIPNPAAIPMAATSNQTVGPEPSSPAAPAKTPSTPPPANPSQPAPALQPPTTPLQNVPPTAPAQPVEVINEPARALIRSYVALRTEGCTAERLKDFQKALSGINDPQVSPLCMAISGLGSAALGNHSAYSAMYKSLSTSAPNSPYLEYLTGVRVTEDCKGCAGKGIIDVPCSGCMGRGDFSAATGTFRCPRCNGLRKTQAKCVSCNGQAQVFSPARASATLATLLRLAEPTIAQTYGDLSKYLTEEASSKLAAVRVEEVLNERSHWVRLELFQVLSDGALARVVSSFPSIQVATSSYSKPLIFVKGLERGLADGEKWSGQLWLIGSYRYVTRGEYEKTVKLFTADKGTAARMLKEKGGDSAAADSDIPSNRDGAGSSRGPHERTRASSGTGWLTLHGYVITCNHVVEGHNKLFIKSQKIAKAPVKLVQKDKANDIAVLKPESLSGLPPGLPLATDDAFLSQKVFTLGYPQTQLLGDALKYTEGVVSAKSGMDNDPRFLQVSVPVQAGNSGGPLINKKGEVAGIIVSKLAALRVFALTGDLPENVNYAVKVVYVRPLLSTLEQREFPVFEPKKLEVEEWVPKLSDSVVMVVAE